VAVPRGGRRLTVRGRRGLGGRRIAQGDRGDRRGHDAAVRSHAATGCRRVRRRRGACPVGPGVGGAPPGVGRALLAETGPILRAAHAQHTQHLQGAHADDAPRLDDLSTKVVGALDNLTTGLCNRACAGNDALPRPGRQGRYPLKHATLGRCLLTGRGRAGHGVGAGRSAHSRRHRDQGADGERAENCRAIAHPNATFLTPGTGCLAYEPPSPSLAPSHRVRPTGCVAAGSRYGHSGHRGTLPPRASRTKVFPRSPLAQMP